MPTLPLVRIPATAAAFRFGAPAGSARSSALLRFDDGWTIGRGAREGWAVVGDAEGRKLAVETLLSRHRISPIPPPPGLFPYLTTLSPSSPSSLRPIRHLAFARPPTTGEFTDFTARYGALQEEDRLSFRQTLSALHPSPTPEEILRVARLLHIDHLLDLPSVSLSSGQTRRARIAAALLTRPALLLLEDPMAGLDVRSRAEVSEILGRLNESADPRIVLVLRAKGAEALPDWVNHVAEVKEGQVWVGPKEEWKSEEVHRIDVVEDEERVEAEPVVKLTGVSVSYGEGTRQVLKNVSWDIRPGDRWHLQGANGSGKTTLLSLVLGHHPRSFSLPSSALTLFSRPRRETPTPTLRKLIGHTSPEIFAAFPRGMGLSALAAVGSGFEGVFSRRDLTKEQKDRILYLLEYFRPLLIQSRHAPAPSTGPGTKQGELTAVDLARKQFSHYTPPQQALLLFLRAIASRPQLLILDEPVQGVDEAIWARCRELLDQEWKEMKVQGTEQAVIVVSHYEDEVPWSKTRGKVLKLIDGVATVE